MSTPRLVTVPFLIAAVISVSACGSSTNTTAAASSDTPTHGMPITVPDAGGMKMSSKQPENDAAAVAALQAHNTTAATHDLRTALGSRHEPAAAQRYARRALGMLAGGKAAAAEVPAIRGAAVEHLTYALAALKAREAVTAAGHLMEAAMLPPAARSAAAALAAIRAHNLARAVTVVSQALRGLGA